MSKQRSLNQVINECPAQCDQPGCRAAVAVVTETPNGRRWYFCAEHGRAGSFA